MTMPTKYPEQSEADKKLWAKYLELFKIAWKAARPFFDKATEDRNMYEQEPDPNPKTMSDISLGEARKFVEQALPPIWFHLMGSENPFELIPAFKTITFEKARSVRDWVLFNMLTVMNLYTEGYLCLKEAVKLGNGYLLIEPKFVTPPAFEEKIVYAGNERISTRDTGIGKAVMVPGCTYIPFGQVIPTPDGKNPDEVSCTFVERFYPEDVFRDMLNKELNPNTPFTGNADQIIEYARSNSMDGYIRSPRQIAAQIAGLDRTIPDMMNNSGNKDTPVSIPVLHCYGRKEHVFFACGKFNIYHKKGGLQTLRTPLAVATFDPDGNNWFTPGIIRPRRSMINGIEDFYRAILDIVTMHLHPHQVVNRDYLLNSKASTDLQPYGKTVITGTGKASDVVSFVTPPAIPQFLMEIGNRLEEKNESSAGQPKSLQGQGTAGLVRGGSGAMESLRQSTSGREKMSANHQEKGWYTAIVEHTLILCQMLSNDKEMMQKLQYNPTTGKSDLAWEEITRDDIRQVYRVQLSFTEKMSNQLAEIQRNAMIYDRGIKNQFVNPKEAFALLVGNTKQYRQLTEGVNPEENIAAMQAMAGKGSEQGGENAPPEQTIVGGAGTAMGGLQE
jgi:hypothetical protein